ncbi:hypothetical protein T4D_3655 [Trichinella pseudospiralis]|uniref:Uncharacterized protein n=1 Tax=Trichinella pseudospiralis TaxID=6337 RepID=A0A0V1FNF9_TRIPS|nr:hypothetical protein T4D_3655 [Trichinella pseudospiralis]
MFFFLSKVAYELYNHRFQNGKKSKAGWDPIFYKSLNAELWRDELQWCIISKEIQDVSHVQLNRLASFLSSDVVESCFLF